MGRNPNVLFNTQKETDHNQMVASRPPFGRFIYVTFSLSATGTDPYKALQHTDDAPQHILRSLRAFPGILNHSFGT